jgi:hypothetical protein
MHNLTVEDQTSLKVDLYHPDLIFLLDLTEKPTIH